VPLALSQGTFDGLSSTDESLASAKLWESGVKYGFEDHKFVGFYVPMISQSFFKKLPPDLQAMVIDLWRENIPAYRKSMEVAQSEARHTLEKNGIVFVSPNESALAEIRLKMSPTQDSIAKELRISPALLSQVQSDVKTGH
jgi:TRAP-type transport system periplasmic protein